MTNASRECQHCGTPLTPQQENFCCTGCENIHTLLKEIPEQDRHATSRILSASDKRYQFLDQTDFRSLYQHDTEGRKFQFYIDGIHCASCIKLLESLPLLDSTVSSSELHFGENILEITLSPQGQLSNIASLIHRMGYIPHPLAKGFNLREELKRDNRKDLIRIGVAAGCAMNIMLFSISVYAGLTGSMGVLFNWLQFILFIPILLFSAVPFYRGSLRALRYGQISIDLPITIALVASSFFSVASILQGGNQVYFDSTASFVLLILSSRYLLKRIQQKTQESSFFSEFMQKPGAWVKSATGLIFKPITSIEVGEILTLPRGERIPVDGILLSPRASIDFSVITGESAPRTISQGMAILAGSRSYTDGIEVKAEKTKDSTQLGEMLRTVELAQNRKTPLLNKADKAAQILILVVNLAALVFYFYYANINKTEAFSRALALIVLACPCALALGAPLALSQGLRRALRLGIIVKSPEIFEKALSTKSVAFDKTGTLTVGSLNLYEAPLMSQQLKSVLLGLESQSQHPIAFSLRKIWGSLPTSSVENLKEIPGVGVQGKIDGHFYEFQSETSQGNNLGPSASLYRDGQKILSLNFADKPREEAATVIQDLSKMGIQSFILSGDREAPVEATAKKLNIPPEHTFSNFSPVDKQNWLVKHPQTIMVGDGANDLLSMSDSHFSVAVRGAVHEALKSSDVYISADNLGKLKDLFLLAKETQKVVWVNISFALLYNFAAGTAALMGLVGPLGSAVLMPLSSLLIISNSFFGTRKLRELEKASQLENKEELCLVKPLTTGAPA